MPRRRPPSSRRRPRYNTASSTNTVHGYDEWTNELENEQLRIDLERLRLENEHLRWENEQLPPRSSAPVANIVQKQ